MMHTSPRRALMFTLSAALAAFPASAADDYKLGPDSMVKRGVPQGKVTKHSWTSKIFPGTVRDYWVYVPAQYDGSTPACVMVFQDGGGYVKPDGSWRVPTVFDNLIHEKSMPVTIGVFIDPGVVPPVKDGALPRFNRSYEYDGLGPEYARMLLEEILPEVGKTYKLAQDASSRAIAGASSGAIAAFTAAWERPDAFSRVFSTIGTYVGLRGGNAYPMLVRKTEPKPLRVFLQDGSNDLNNYVASWWVANQDMLAALQYSGYEVSHVWGDGAHNSKQGAAVLPDALRWLWKGYPAAPRAGVASKQDVVKVLAPDEDWKLVADGLEFSEGPAANAKGELFFTDIPRNRIHKVGLDGKVSIFAEKTGGANGLMFGPDGKLYAAQGAKKRVVAYLPDGKATVVATGIEANDLAVTYAGDLYVTEPAKKQVWFVARNGKKRVVDTGIGSPNGVLLTPDQSLLNVSDSSGQFIYSFQVQADGSLAHKQRYCYLHVPDGERDSGADGMAVDTQGRLYVATRMGVQFCDQPGRVHGIIRKPHPAWLANVEFAGPERDELYATIGDRVYKRKMRAKGVFSFEAPLTPPKPGL